MKHCIISVIVAASIVGTVACGSATPSAPTTPTPTPTSTPTLVALTGTVSAVGGARLAGATVRIGDGVNAGRSATTSNIGEYRLDNLTAGNANVSAAASGYEEKVGGVYINGANTLNFTLRTAAPWSRSGTGNTVFDMPTYITRVRIIGTYTAGGSNFIVYIGGRLIVNDIIGTRWPSTVSDGMYVTTGGVVQITNSTGVVWSFTETR